MRLCYVIFSTAEWSWHVINAIFILLSGALAKRIQRKDPEDGEHRVAKEQQQSTRLRMDDGPNDAVVFGRTSERGLHLSHRRSTRRHCHSQPDDCLKFQISIPANFVLLLFVLLLFLKSISKILNKFFYE